VFYSKNSQKIGFFNTHPPAMRPAYLKMPKIGRIMQKKKAKNGRFLSNFGLFNGYFVVKITPKYDFLHRKKTYKKFDF
jgi:hypothetical protein